MIKRKLGPGSLVIRRTLVIQIQVIFCKQKKYNITYQKVPNFLKIHSIFLLSFEFGFYDSSGAILNCTDLFNLKLNWLSSYTCNVLAVIQQESVNFLTCAFKSANYDCTKSQYLAGLTQNGKFRRSKRINFKQYWVKISKKKINWGRRCLGVPTRCYDTD